MVREKPNDRKVKEEYFEKFQHTMPPSKSRFTAQEERQKLN